MQFHNRPLGIYYYRNIELQVTLQLYYRRIHLQLQLVLASLFCLKENKETLYEKRIQQFYVIASLRCINYCTSFHS